MIKAFTVLILLKVKSAESDKKKEAIIRRKLYTLLCCIRSVNLYRDEA